ncbi:MAG: SMI1/KNR4 family protein [Lentisphaeraceae bacterium]|nr:SMI1/KNR4 family protein [Lentisphaeraceae bacterium]
MKSYSTKIIPHFNPPELSSLDMMESLIKMMLKDYTEAGLLDLFELPLVSDYEATESEISSLENELAVKLPEDYRLFLQKWRYLSGGSGMEIFGLGYKGISNGEPWVSTEHKEGFKYLVIGEYFKFSDGDQLLIDLNSPDQKVLLYLHDQEESIELFANNFSEALYRIKQDK